MAGKKTNQTEQRQYQLELRAVDDSTRRIQGQAVVYGKTVEMGYYDPWDEQIAPGAATEALKSNDQYLLWQHDMAQPLASVASGTLALEEKSDGVYFIASLPDTSQGRDAYTLIKDKIIDQMSVGFTVGTQEWKNLNDKEKKDLRIIKKFESVLEISMVTKAAYPQTSVEAKHQRSLAYRLAPVVELSTGRVAAIRHAIVDTEQFLLKRNLL